MDGEEIALSSFPLTLTARPEPYIISALLPKICGDLVRRDTFRVFAPTTPTLISPAQDTAVCSSGGRFLLKASPSGGSWDPNLRIVQEGDQFYFDLDGPGGIETLTYRIGSGDCERSTQVIISTQQVDVDLGSEQEDLCLDDEEFTLSATPAGGTWEGSGIVAGNHFNANMAGDGDHLLTYEFMDEETGCRVEKAKTISVHPLPELNLVDSLSTCLVNEEISLASLTNVQGLPEEGTYRWEGQGVIDADAGRYNPSRLGDMGVDTVTVIYTSPPGCATTAQALIRVEELVAARTPPDSTLCLGGETSLTLPGFPGGGTWNGSWIDENTGRIDLTFAEAGSFLYEYSIQEGTACESTDITTLTFVPGGAVNAGEDLYVCISEAEVMLQGVTPANGNWSGPGLTNGNVVAIQDLEPGSFEYTYEAPDLPAACNSDIRQLVIDSIPRAAFMADSVACIDVPLSLEAQPSHAGWWQWNLDNGTIGNAETVEVVYQQPGNYSVQLQVATLNPLTNELLCRNSLTRQLIVTEPPPVVDFTVSDTTGCGPLTVLVDNRSQGDYLNFQWVVGDTTLTEVEEPGMFTLLAAQEDTVYTIDLTVSNGCGENSRSAMVRVLPTPRADFGVDFEQPCSGDTLLLNNTSTGNPEFNHWQFDNGLEFNQFNPPIIRPQTDTLPRDMAVELISSNACGADTVIKMITVFPTDVRALINISDRTICVNDTLVLTSFSTPGAYLEWQLPNGNTLDERQVFPIFSVPGSYHAKLYAERCGLDSAMVEFEVLPLPELAVNGDFLTCKDASTFFRLESNVAGHVLYFGNGDSTLLNDIEFTFDTPGSYDLHAVAVSPEGCRSDWSGNVMVEGNPEVAFSFMDSLCARTSVRFVADGDSDFSCQWLFDGVDRSDNCQPEYTFAESGLHPVQLTRSTAIGCRDSLLQWVYVRPTPTADFAIEVIEDCDPAQFQFSDQSVGATGLSWDLGNGNSTTIEHPSQIYENPGPYQIRLQASYDGLCFDEAVKTIEVFPRPQIEIQLDEQCTQAEGVEVRIATDIRSFILPSNEAHSVAGDLHLGLQPGVYQVRAEAENGCIAWEKLNVLPVQELEISVPEDSFFIVLGETVQLDVQANLSSATYQWEPATPLDAPSWPQPLATPFMNTNFVVLVTDDRGCTKLDSIYVAVEIEREAGIYLPNAFTPDGSGHNDIFRLRLNNPGVRKINAFRVFDRWGELIFEALDCLPGDVSCVWDGTFRGQPAAIDVYVFAVEIEFVDGRKKVLKGDLNLIR